MNEHRGIVYLYKEWYEKKLIDLKYLKTCIRVKTLDLNEYKFITGIDYVK